MSGCQTFRKLLEQRFFFFFYYRFVSFSYILLYKNNTRGKNIAQSNTVVLLISVSPRVLPIYTIHTRKYSAPPKKLVFSPTITSSFSATATRTPAKTPARFIPSYRYMLTEEMCTHVYQKKPRAKLNTARTYTYILQYTYYIIIVYIVENGQHFTFRLIYIGIFSRPLLSTYLCACIYNIGVVMWN